MRGLRAGALVLLFAASAGARGAKPKPDKPEQVAPPVADLDTAEKQYGDLDYEEANRTADRVLQQRGLSHDQLVRGYRILALTAAILDHPLDARDAFTRLLTYNPEFVVDPNLGPKVTTPFVEARGFWRGQTGKPGIEVLATAHTGEAPTLRVTTRDPTHVVEGMLVGYRWGANSAYTSRSTTVGEGVILEVPTPPPGAARLDYYVQAFDHRDNVVFEVGNPAAPRSVTVEAPPPLPPPPPAPEKRSILASPVFWGVVVGVLAAGGAGAYFLTRPRDPTSASLGGGIACGGAPCP